MKLITAQRFFKGHKMKQHNETKVSHQYKDKTYLHPIKLAGKFNMFNLLPEHQLSYLSSYDKVSNSSITFLCTVTLIFMNIPRQNSDRFKQTKIQNIFCSVWKMQENIIC